MSEELNAVPTSDSLEAPVTSVTLSDGTVVTMKPKITARTEVNARRIVKQEGEEVYEFALMAGVLLFNGRPWTHAQILDDIDLADMQKISELVKERFAGFFN